MIELLNKNFSFNKVAHSWIINTNSPIKALEELKLFILKKFFMNNGLLNSNVDFKLINQLNDNRNISIEQIRELQLFLSLTSANYPYKVAIIYKADLMSTNAFNCCLKLLESNNERSYIFLITDKIGLIPDTILSRCAKINHYINNDIIIDDDYNNFIKILIDDNKENLLHFIDVSLDKNKETWHITSKYFLLLISRMIKYAIDIKNLSLTPIEEIIYKKINNNINNLLTKYHNINTLINDTNKYDLDLKISYILLLEQFKIL